MSDHIDAVARWMQRLARDGQTASTVRCTERMLARAATVARDVFRTEGDALTRNEVEGLLDEVLDAVSNREGGGDEESDSFDGWVREIAREVRRNPRGEPGDPLVEDGLIEAGHEALARLSREARRAILVGVIERAPDATEQDVLFHRYVHELTCEQIAGLMDLADADAVRMVLNRASPWLGPAVVSGFTAP